MINNIGIFTSGGDSPGMNAAIRAVVKAAKQDQIDTFGIYRGYEGMISGDISKLELSTVSGIIQRGGTILKSARSKQFHDESVRKKAFQQLKRNQIDALVAIGGDGTFTGANIFSKEFNIPIIGLPGTIDNDLYGTDFTIGYDTALNTAVQAIDKIRDTANSHDRLFIVEVMGKDAGFIALRSGIAAGAEAILVPETERDTNLLHHVLASGFRKEKRSLIVVVAEGDETGGALALHDSIQREYPSYDVRTTVLGHLQRGGSPSAMDRVLASRLGVAAVQELRKSNRSGMVGIQNGNISFTPFQNAIKHHDNLNPDLLALAELLGS